jgi:hypothetical protein
MAAREQPDAESGASEPAVKGHAALPDGDDAGGSALPDERRLTPLPSSADQAPNIKRENQVLLLEHYTAPCGKYPKGRKVVVCDNTVVRYEEALPFEFYTNPVNPYPCVELSDTGSVGQFWNTTWIAQLVPLQRMLNRMLFRGAEGRDRYKILERFYRLKPGLIERFYAGNSSNSDKARILIGKPPIPIGKAITAIRSKKK